MAFFCFRRSAWGLPGKTAHSASMRRQAVRSAETNAVSTATQRRWCTTAVADSCTWPQSHQCGYAAPRKQPAPAPSPRTSVPGSTSAPRRADARRARRKSLIWWPRRRPSLSTSSPTKLTCSTWPWHKSRRTLWGLKCISAKWQKSTSKTSKHTARLICFATSAERWVCFWAPASRLFLNARISSSDISMWSTLKRPACRMRHAFVFGFSVFILWHFKWQESLSANPRRHLKRLDSTRNEKGNDHHRTIVRTMYI